MPVPLNHTTTHGTQLSNTPDYFAISKDQHSFIEMSHMDFTSCAGSPLRTCPLIQGQRATRNPTCASLFLEHSPSQYCRFRLQEHVVEPMLKEVEEGLALLSNITEVIFTCRNQVYKKPGCMFCLIKLPCECAFQIPPRLTACTDDHDTAYGTLYPLNLALLERLFNSSTLTAVLTSSVFTEPVNYSIPQLQIDEHSLQTYLEQASKLDGDLDSISDKMKKNEKVYRQMSSYALTRDIFGSCEFEYKNPTNIIGAVALVLSASLLVVVVFMFYVFMYRPLRTLCLALW